MAQPGQHRGAHDWHLLGATEGGSSSTEPLDLMGIPTRDQGPRVLSGLEEVGLGAEHLARYPSQLSGGQRQRVCIARALLCRPEVLICDEVVAALDMAIQVQVVDLLKESQARHGFAMLFISHDLDMVQWIADEIAVMRHGEIVDRCEPGALSDAARHHYTRQLLAARLNRQVVSP